MSTIADDGTKTVEIKDGKIAVIKPKRKYKRRAVAVKIAKPAIAPSEFAGLTQADCCDACNVRGCVLSGNDICMHPYKGGLHAPQLRNPEIVKRFNRAKAYLKNAK